MPQSTKRDAVRALLLEDLERSNREIAKLAGTSHRLVGEVRRELAAAVPEAAAPEADAPPAVAPRELASNRDRPLDSSDHASHRRRPLIVFDAGFVSLEIV